MEKLGMRGSHTRDANMFALKQRGAREKSVEMQRHASSRGAAKVLFNKTGRQRERDSEGSKGEF